MLITMWKTIKRFQINIRIKVDLYGREISKPSKPQYI